VVQPDTPRPAHGETPKERELLDPRPPWSEHPSGNRTIVLTLTDQARRLRGRIVHTLGKLETRPMTRREKAALALELAFATALAFAVAAILYQKVGLPLLLALPTGELTWAGMILYFVR
jgi:hypothetical protein